MDLQIVILSEVRQTEKKYIWSPSYVESKEMVQMNLFTKQSPRCRKQTYGYQGGKGQGYNGRLGLTYIHYYI